MATSVLSNDNLKFTSDGSTSLVTMTATENILTLDSARIKGLTDPADSQDAATKAYVDSVATGLSVRGSVVAATTAAVTLATDLANNDSIDGVTLATGDRILVKDQSTASENGIYVVQASGAPTRATDFDADADVASGAFVFVKEGTTNADKGFVLTTDDGTGIEIGDTALAFTQFSSAGSSSSSITDSTATLALSSGALTLSSATTVDLDGSGAMQLNSSGGAISIGNDAVAQAINVGTGAAARTITVGNATGATAVNLTAGTGGVALASTGTGDITLDSDDTLLLDADGVLELNSSAGAINIGNDDVDQAINIGTQGERTVSISTGAFASTVNVGNVTGATSVTINAGSGGIHIGDDDSFGGTLTIGDGQGNGAIRVGDGGERDVTVGSQNGPSSLTLQGGSNGIVLDTTGVLELNSSAGAIGIGNDAVAQAINIGTGAAARTITVGNATGATALDINLGTGGLTVDCEDGGAISLDANGAPSNLTLASTADADDLTVAVTGNTDSSLVLSSTGTGADALQVTASAGGLDIASASTLDLSTTAGNSNITLTPHGTGEVDISKVDIDGGAIDGTAIGASSASTGAFTTLTASTSLDVTGSAGIILENDETITNSTDGVVLINGVVAAGTGSGAGVFQSNGDQDLTLQTGNNTTGTITITDGANGNIAITPNGTGEVDISKVDIDGGAIDGTIIGANSAAAATFTTASAATFTSTSDARLKQDVTELEGALDKLQSVRGVHFTWKESGKADTGVIAQEVEAVLPHAVRTREEDDIKEVDYGKLAPLLIQAIKEQQAQIAELTARLAAVESA